MIQAVYADDEDAIEVEVFDLDNEPDLEKNYNEITKTQKAVL